MKVLFPACLVFLPRLAMAAQGHDAHGEHGIPWSTLLFSTINLLIFVAILKRFAWPAIRSWTQDRTQEVVATLEQAARARAEAEQLKAEWQARMANLSRELEEMRGQARQEMAREREQILDAAEKAAAAIRADAQRATTQDVRDAQTRLRHEVARQALAMAREMVPKEVKENDQERFVTEFLDKVEA